MKKLFALLLALIMVFSFAACGNSDNPDPSGSDNPGISQTDDSGKENDNGSETNGSSQDTDSSQKPYEDETGKEAWPQTDLTALVPTPAQGNVLRSSLSDTFSTIEVSWTYDEALAYVQQLKDAGFGDDIVEKFEQQKVIKRTHNGVEIYLVYMDDTLTMITLTKE